MVVKLGDYIVSPLAMGSRENYAMVCACQTRLRSYEAGTLGVQEPFVASMLPDNRLDEECRKEEISIDRYTRFERMAILAASRAVRAAGIDASSSRVAFVLATTKGNIAQLPSGGSRVGLADAAKAIAGWFGNSCKPLVVSNACISGLSAQIEAKRMIEIGSCDCAVVIGADELTQFIVAGFQSLKAMSADLCRPFDEDRTGLNLGEAAACIVYGKADHADGRWSIADGAVRNDAFHLSSPSKTAEGAYRALHAIAVRSGLSDVAFVNVHGTATLFNDEMESRAIDRMGLADVPAFALKGYFGHTMGAAGVLETIISMMAADSGEVPATKGFNELGVSRKIGISAESAPCGGKAFVKMMSGFGGCNAAVLFSKNDVAAGAEEPETRKRHSVMITSTGVLVDNVPQKVEGEGMEMLKNLYRSRVGDYPKFHKMDPLSKLGFIASELILDAEAKADGVERFADREDRAVAILGKSASICADRTFQQTIVADNYFPSPSAFVYTLPNILAGEIAIRNHYYGETSYTAVESAADVDSVRRRIFSDPSTRSVLYGFVDVADENEFGAVLYIDELKK